MPGLNLSNLAAAPPPEPDKLAPIDVDLDDVAQPDTDQGASVELADGSVVINIGPPKPIRKSAKWNDNLAEDLSDAELGNLADELLRGIEADNESRKEWLEDRAQGIKLLGLRIEAMRSSAGDDAAPVEGMSTVRHPLVLEALIRFQANALGELYPADGPVKVRDDDPNSSTEEDDLGDYLEKDLNHYLTSIDKDYIPDSDAGLWRIGLDGSGFKKVYHDPLKRRPVSLFVSAEDIIVSNTATSIRSSGRVTHRSFMRPSIMKRMQLSGAYRDISLGDPGYAEKNSVDKQTEDATGVVKNEAFEPRDRDYEVYESYCELDLPGFEHETKGRPDGMDLPYKVVIEKESRQILEIRRNWKEDGDLFEPRVYFVQFPFIRGFGFYGIGLSHVLGNTTNALTAAWREMLDSGMFASFPGFLYAKAAGRQNSNTFRIPPGGGAPIETGGLPIGQAVMPLPYKTPDPAFMQFVDNVAQTGQRIGGTAEVMVGEGRQDAPVGTTLALIEQATKPMAAVHKRLCQAQAEEFALLVERFREDPESFWRFNKSPSTPWNQAKFEEAINNYDIVPQADPNTHSHMQRMARAQGLAQAAQTDPTAFDLNAVRRQVLKALGYNNPDEFLAKTDAPPAPDPKAQASLISAQADMLDSQTKAKQLAFQQQNSTTEDQNRDQDRQAKLQVAELQLRREQMVQNAQMAHERAMAAAKTASDHGQHAQDLHADATSQQRDHLMQGLSQLAQHTHDERMQGLAALNRPTPNEA